MARLETLRPGYLLCKYELYTCCVCLQSVADARVSLTGHVRPVPDDQQTSFRQLYQKKNTESFWAEFGDFKAYHMAEVLAVHFNGGFGRAGTRVRLSIR